MDEKKLTLEELLNIILISGDSFNLDIDLNGRIEATVYGVSQKFNTIESAISWSIDTYSLGRKSIS